MSQDTPVKSKNSIHGFSPIILRQCPGAVTPQKNLTGLPRVARDIVADVYNNIQKWNDHHIKGCQIVKDVAIIKSEDPKNMTAKLEKLINELYDLVQNLLIYSKALEFLASQMNAIAQLHKKSCPLFISLTVESLACLVYDIAEAYKLEYKTKEYVMENIAHSCDKNEAMFHAACWTHQQHITDRILLNLETLLIETAHRKVV